LLSLALHRIGSASDCGNTAEPRVKSIFTLFLIVCCFFLAACQLETSTVKMAEVLRHENGLIVNRPEGYIAEKTETGFAMAQSEELRSPLTLHIDVFPNGKRPNVAPSWFGLFGFRYRVDKSEGGSGGAFYQLTAVHPLQQCWLVLSAQQQSENEPPSFLEAWAVLDNASVGKNLTCEN
jgi:hypothetical protein